MPGAAAARREDVIHRVLEHTVGPFDDLTGSAGPH